MFEKIKKILSLFVSAVILFTFVPGTMVASATLNNNATVVSYGDGVEVPEGIELKSILEDDFFYRAKDFQKTSAVLYDESTGTNNLDKVVKFTQTDSGIVYEWAEAIKLARMDLWMLNCGGIGDYVVEYFDGSEWQEAASGNLDKNDATSVAENKGAIASYYPIVFNEVIETTSLRFVIKSFSEAENPVAYISEAKLYDNNDINYGAAYYTSSTVGTNKMYKLSNPYLTNFTCSWISGGGATGTGSASHMYWPGDSSGNPYVLRPYSANTSYNNNLWYATTFGQSKVKVNKVGINLFTTSGSIKQFTVWAAVDNSSAAMTISNNNMYQYYPLANNALKTKWQKVATIDCNITTDDRNQVFSIPNAVEASAYMIEVTEASDWTYKADGSINNGSLVNISGLEMYTVRDEELSDISKATGTAFEAIATDLGLSDEAMEYIDLPSSYIDSYGNVYSTEWSFDIEKSDLVNRQENRINIGFHDDEEILTLTLKLTAEDDSSISYTASKDILLRPLSNDLKKITLSNMSVSDGESSSVLTDSIYYSPYEILNGREADIKKMVSVDSSNSYIEYEWMASDYVNGFDLWVYPQGAIKDYEILFSEDGVNFLDSVTGTFDNDSAVGNSAVYYPVVFPEKNTKSMRFIVKSFNEGFSGENVYISEAKPFKDKTVNYLESVNTADGENIAYSHYMQGYIVSAVADEDTVYLKDRTRVWPIRADGSIPAVKANAGEAFYATGFSVPAKTINRVIVPLTAGTAKEIEVLYAAGTESGFEWEATEPDSPDSVADYETAANVYGNFSTTNPAVIDIPEGINSKYILIKVKGCSAGMELAKPQFIYAEESKLSKLNLAAKEIFKLTTTDLESSDADEAKLRINLIKSFEFEGEQYLVDWSSNNKLVDTETGEISEHENDDKAILTAYVKSLSDNNISYLAIKEFNLRGLRTISKVLSNGTTTVDSAGILSDEFYFTPYENSQLSDPRKPIYNLNKFIPLSLNEGIEFKWETPQNILTRFELWAWPIDAIKNYNIMTSADGITWDSHYSGTILDRYADKPENRPDDTGTNSSYFYNIVFSKPAKNVKYIRFIVTELRDGADTAYVSEALFDTTNDVNFLQFGTIKNTDKWSKSYSKYASTFFASNTNDPNTEYNDNPQTIWPTYSDGSKLSIVKYNDAFWYATSFNGAPIALNKATLRVSRGTVYEYEILYADTYSQTGRDAGLLEAPYPEQPDLSKKWHTVARVSGVFNANDISEIYFDNETPGLYWMVKVIRASDDAAINQIEFYQTSPAELPTSCYSSVLDSVFDNVSDTEFDNIIKEKLNIPSTLQRDADGDGIDETYEVVWSDDKNLINPDGTFSQSMTDTEIILTARIGLPGEKSRHIVKKSFILLGTDTRLRTTIYEAENISVSANNSETVKIELNNGFSYVGKKELELDFDDSVQNGKITLLSGEDVLVEFEVENGKLLYKEHEIALDSKIKLEIDNNSISILKKSDSGYMLVLYGDELMQKGEFNSIKFTTAENQSIVLNSAIVNVASEELFETVCEQFDFEKISPDYRATNLNGDITLFDNVTDDIIFEVVSSNSDVVRIDDENNKGIVNVSSPGESTLTFTVKSTKLNKTFEKSFDVLTGRKNIASKAVSASGSVALDGKNAGYAADGCLESEFATNAGSWRVNVNLKEEKEFNVVRFYTPKVATTQIESFKIFVSNDNIDYTEIYRGGKVENGIDFKVPYTKAQYIRIEATTTSPGTSGIREICLYNEMSDEEKQAYDFNTLVQGLNVVDGVTVNKEGAFGTRFTIVSNNSAVRIEETADKTKWKIVIGKSPVETTAEITLSAQYGTLTPLTKTYNVLLLADIVIDDKLPSGGGSSGGGSGGGSSTSAPGNKVSDDKNEPTTPPVDPDISNMPVEGLKELNSHWAENEIKTLIAKGIVSGNGISLNLDGNVTRAEFCKMIVTGFKLETPSYSGIYPDIAEDDWFAIYAETAHKYGIMTGDATGFRGNDFISRQEMAVVLVRLLGEDNSDPTQDTTSDESENINIFADENSIYDWAKESVTRAAEKGLLNGYEDGSFKPLNNLRRDEAMVVIYRALSLVADNERGV